MPRGTETSAEGDSKWAELHQHTLRSAQLSMWFKQLLLKCPWPDEHQSSQTDRDHPISLCSVYGGAGGFASDLLR